MCQVEFYSQLVNFYFQPGSIHIKPVRHLFRVFRSRFFFLFFIHIFPFCSFAASLFSSLLKRFSILVYLHRQSKRTHKMKRLCLINEMLTQFVTAIYYFWFLTLSNHPSFSLSFFYIFYRSAHCVAIVWVVCKCSFHFAKLSVR